MTTLLVILHFIALAVGIGGGIANLIGMRVMRGAPPETTLALRRTALIVGRAAFVSVLILWITGIWLVFAAQGGFGGLPLAFWVKLAAVVVLTLAGVTAQLRILAAQRGGPPPAPVFMWRLGVVSSTAALVALICAILAFH